MKKTFIMTLWIFILAVFIGGCSCNPENIKDFDSNAAMEKKSIPKVGDTIKFGNTQITLNAVRYSNTINEQNNQFMISTAPKGEIFCILDLTIKNTGKTQAVYSNIWMQPKIVDTKGYTYNNDFEAGVNLKKSLKEGTINPGMQIRGELAFKVNAGSKKFDFLLSPNSGPEIIAFKL